MGKRAIPRRLVSPSAAGLGTEEDPSPPGPHPHRAGAGLAVLCGRLQSGSPARNSGVATGSPRVLTFPVSVARVTRQKSQLGLTGVLCGSLSSGRGHAGPLDVAEAGPSDFVSNGFLCVTAGVQATEEENGYSGFRQH